MGEEGNSLGHSWGHLNLKLMLPTGIASCQVPLALQPTPRVSGFGVNQREVVIPQSLQKAPSLYHLEKSSAEWPGLSTPHQRSMRNLARH